MKKIILPAIPAIIVLIFIFLICTENSSAATCDCNGTITNVPSCSGGGCPSVCSCMDNSTAGGSVTLDNPLGQNVSVQNLIGRIINAVLGIVGSLALVMFIYGGFIWMLAAGNNERVQRGKDIIIWAVIGLVIIFSAYALVKLVFSGLKG